MSTHTRWASGLAVTLMVSSATVPAYAQNTWTPVSGERAIVCSSLTASTDTTLWMLGQVGAVTGAFRSTDGGASFSRLTLPGAGSTATHLLAFDADRAVVIARDVLARNWTALSTTDGGANWSGPVNVAPLNDGAGNAISVVAARRTGARAVMVVTTDRVTVSTDAGATWMRTGGGPPSARAGAIFGSVASDDTIFAVVEASRAITRSVDGGAAWRTVFADDSTAPPSARLDAFTGVYFFDETLGFAGTTLRGTFRTADGGATWTPVTQPNVAGDVPRLREAAFASSELGLAVMRDRSSGSGQWSIHSTTNGGRDWVADVLPADFFSMRGRQPGCFTYPRAGLAYAGTTAAGAYSLIRFGAPGSMTPTDAGAPTTDAAMPTTDAAMPTTDAGTPVVDSAMPLADSAMPAADVGSPASGGGGGGGCSTSPSKTSPFGLWIAGALALARRRRRGRSPQP